MKNKKLLLWLIPVAVLVAAVVTCILVFGVGPKNWQNILASVLEKAENFDGATKVGLNLIDLDNNKVPELLMTMPEKDGNYITKIFSVKDKEYIVNMVASYEDYLFEYLYNVKEDSKKVYEINVGEKETVKETDLNYEKDVVVVKKAEDRLEYQVDSKNNDVWNTLEKTYTKNDSLVTDEVKEEVENTKMLSNIDKIDDSKPLVYTVKSVKSDVYANVTGQTLHNYYEYPAININNEDIIAINKDIAKNNQYDDMDIETGFFGEIEVITYDYYVNDNILSVVLIHGGNESTWNTIYNIDLKTGKEIAVNDLLKDVDLTEVNAKIKEYAINMMEKTGKDLNLKEYWGDQYDTELANIKKKLDENLASPKIVFKNADNDLILRVEFEVFGGQYTCTKMVEVNLTKNSEITEVKYEDYVQRGPNTQNK